MMKNIDKDYIRLGALLTITGAFWVSTMANANATQHYSVEDSCYYGVKKEQITERMPDCFDAIAHDLETLLMEVRAQIKQMREVSNNKN